MICQYLSASVLLIIYTLHVDCLSPITARHIPKPCLEQELTNYLLKEEQNIDLEYILGRIVKENDPLYRETLDQIAARAARVKDRGRNTTSQLNNCHNAHSKLRR